MPDGPESRPSLSQNLSSNQRETDQARVREMREESARLLALGSSATEITRQFARRTERFLLEIYDDALTALPQADQPRVSDNSAVFFIGGSGREEMCPHSDVDMLFLYRQSVEEPFAAIVASVVRRGWDAGLRVAHAVRTLDDTLHMARQEPEIATALTEARPITGQRTLISQFQVLLRNRMIRHRLRAFYHDCLASRAKERGEHGDTPCILEPDVKRSAGGLRDVHLLRWIGYARFGTTELDRLRGRGTLSQLELAQLTESYEFLLKVRIELHLQANRANDMLTREEQQRLAQSRGIAGEPGVRPVERFMQLYLRHATTIAEITNRFVSRHRPRVVMSATAESLLTRRMHGVYWIGPYNIAFAPRFRDSAVQSPEQVLELFRISAKSGVRPTQETEDAIRAAIQDWPHEMSQSAGGIFWSILGFDRHLGETLRAMYRCGVLEWVIPELRHARCLIQFNQYHSFTIDEHSFRTVEAGNEFLFDNGALGRARRSVRQPALLNLALFLHDLGKGYDRDHSDVGREIAGNVATRLGLPERDRDLLQLLVHKHLLMVHLALRRDITEPRLLLRFIRELRNSEALKLLFVLSAADLKAVGPGVLTKWKADLLADLYERSQNILTGQRASLDNSTMRGIKNQILHAFPRAAGISHREELAEWAARQLEAFSLQYLATTHIEQIVADLQALRVLQPGDVVTSGYYDPRSNTTEYAVIASKQAADGCFHKTTATLTARRLTILSANIETTLDGTVIDRYRVIDRDHQTAVPSWRIAEVASLLRESLLKRLDIPQLIRANQPYTSCRISPPLSEMPLQVSLDNESSDHATIIDVFANDRPGLLFTLTRTLYELGLKIDTAKISTHLDQVVDVFYVTDVTGRKITDPTQLSHIRDTMLRLLHEFEASGHTEFERTL